jgi:hypothetical protein
LIVALACTFHISPRELELLDNDYLEGMALVMHDMRRQQEARR